MKKETVSIPLVEIIELTLPPKGSAIASVKIRYGVRGGGISAAPSKTCTTRLDLGKGMFLDVHDAELGDEVATFLRLLAMDAALKVSRLRSLKT